MKKLLTFLLALTLVLCLASCDMGDLSELLEDPDASDAQTNIEYGTGDVNVISRGSAYDFEYRENGDGTCAITNIIINNKGVSWSSVKDDDYKVIYGSADQVEDSSSIIKDYIAGDASSIIVSDGTIISTNGQVSITLLSSEIIIPEKNPDGLTVTSIEFGGFDSVVPKRIREDHLYVLFGKECEDEFAKSKVLSYYTYVDDEGGYYELSEEFSNKEIYELGKMLINDFKFNVSGYKTIAEAFGESVPNLALNVKTIIIPSTVKYISDYAFAYCYNLETCEIPEGVEYNNSIFIATELYEENK